MKQIIASVVFLLGSASLVMAAPQNAAQKAGTEVKEGYKDARDATQKETKKVGHNTKQGYKHTRHDVKQGYKNTKSDVKAGVEGAKENKENR